MKHLQTLAEQGFDFSRHNSGYPERPANDHHLKMSKPKPEQAAETANCGTAGKAEGVWKRPAWLCAPAATPMTGAPVGLFESLYGPVKLSGNVNGTYATSESKPNLRCSRTRVSFEQSRNSTKGIRRDGSPFGA